MQCLSSVMCRASSTISLNISSQTSGPFWTKHSRNNSWEVLFNPFPDKPWFLHICCISILKTLCEKEKLLVRSRSLLKTLCEKEKLLDKTLKKSFPKTAGQILKEFHKNVPLMTLSKNCARNFDLSINMALVNLNYLHCMDIKKFL